MTMPGALPLYLSLPAVLTSEEAEQNVRDIKVRAFGGQLFSCDSHLAPRAGDTPPGRACGVFALPSPCLQPRPRCLLPGEDPERGHVPQEQGIALKQPNLGTKGHLWAALGAISALCI